MRHDLVCQFVRDAGLGRRAEEMRSLVGKHVAVVVDDSVPRDVRMEFKPCLDFASANVIGFIEHGRYVEVRHHFFLDKGAASVDLAPSSGKNDFEVGDRSHDALDDARKPRLYRCESTISTPPSGLAVHDTVDIKEENLHRIPPAWRCFGFDGA
jgi:hypothetical protein